MKKKVQQEASNTQQGKPPNVAPGLTEEAIEKEATPEEINRGDFTRVVKLDMDRNVRR